MSRFFHYKLKTTKVVFCLKHNMFRLKYTVNCTVSDNDRGIGRFPPLCQLLRTICKDIGFVRTGGGVLGRLNGGQVAEEAT